MPRKPIARHVDKHELYIRAVQAPDFDVDFFERVYRQEFGQAPRVLREDFCGTFAVCCEWVKRGPDRIAVGVDLDRQPLAWGRKHLLPGLGRDAPKRIRLIRGDVRTVGGPKADLVAAQNFSFWVFRTRPELLDYFRAARRNLGRRGLFVMDMMGGSECYEEGHEDRHHVTAGPIIPGSPRRFTYVWEQERFDPISHGASFHIHFRFRDGSALRRAFSYHWRFWTIPEVRELLSEAGFRRSDVYWEGTDHQTGEGNSVYTRRRRAANEDAWVSYVVGVK